MIETMQKDMSIEPYDGEIDSSFIGRLLYSSLGLWSLVLSSSDGGITKVAQTKILENVIAKYLNRYPNAMKYFVKDENDLKEIIHHIRYTYEAMGYLLPEKEREYLTDINRAVKVGTSSYLSYKFNPNQITMNGLGIYCGKKENLLSVNELLIRDSLSYTEYVDKFFDITEGDYIYNIEVDNLLFFNPRSEHSLSKSWENRSNTPLTIAYDKVNKIYYAVIDNQNEKIYAKLSNYDAGNELTDYEYRRVYFALKSYYNNPVIYTLEELDSKHCLLKINSHLPNREYYFLLMSAWPDGSAYNKTSYIVKKDFIEIISKLLGNMGIFGG